MADDKMKNDDLQRNMGAGQKGGQDYGQGQGQHSPGRSGQGGYGGSEKSGQHAGGQQGGGQFGGQKGTRKMDDEEDDFGAGGAGSQNRGGQNR